MSMATKGKRVWVRDPALKEMEVFFPGTVVSGDGKKVRDTCAAHIPVRHLRELPWLRGWQVIVAAESGGDAEWPAADVLEVRGCPALQPESFERPQCLHHRMGLNVGRMG